VGNPFKSAVADGQELARKGPLLATLLRGRATVCSISQPRKTTSGPVALVGNSKGARSQRLGTEGRGSVADYRLRRAGGYLRPACFRNQVGGPRSKAPQNDRRHSSFRLSSGANAGLGPSPVSPGLGALVRLRFPRPRRAGARAGGAVLGSRGSSVAARTRDEGGFLPVRGLRNRGPGGFGGWERARVVRPPQPPPAGLRNQWRGRSGDAILTSG